MNLLKERSGVMNQQEIKYIPKEKTNIFFFSRTIEFLEKINVILDDEIRKKQ